MVGKEAFATADSQSPKGQKFREKSIDSGSSDRNGLIFQPDGGGPTFSLEHLSSSGKTAFSNATQLSRCDKDSV